MEDIFDIIIQALTNAWNVICDIFETIFINTVVNFLNDVTNYFKGLLLHKGVHTPFIIDATAEEANIFKDLIPESKNNGIIEGVFNNEKNSIDSIRYIGGEGVDEETKKILNNNPIAILNS